LSLSSIHIIGDSHSLSFEGSGAACHWLGATPAMNVWKTNKLISQIFKDNNAYDNVFWFGFGEIDCRIQVYNWNQITGVPEYVLINNTIDCYLNYLASIKIQAKISVLAVPPQGLEENLYNYEFYADRKHRQEITDLYNTTLERRCWEQGIKFIDIWYATPSLERNLWNSQDFKEDLCHMKNAVAISRLRMWYDIHCDSLF
jgi:hypothetical protein